jgi:hypothetical protein
VPIDEAIGILLLQVEEQARVCRFYARQEPRKLASNAAVIVFWSKTLDEMLKEKASGKLTW